MGYCSSTMGYCSSVGYCGSTVGCVAVLHGTAALGYCGVLWGYCAVLRGRESRTGPVGYCEYRCGTRLPWAAGARAVLLRRRQVAADSLTAPRGLRARTHTHAHARARTRTHTQACPHAHARSTRIRAHARAYRCHSLTKRLQSIDQLLIRSIEASAGYYGVLTGWVFTGTYGYYGVLKRHSKGYPVVR
jgi:hypothetical protein